MKFYIVFLLTLMNLKTSLSEKLIPVEYIDQTKDHPTGCESVSTIMCLHFFNIKITVNEFIDNYLEKGEMYYQGNKLFAPHPNDKFIGTPYDSHSYGCYGHVIEKALNKLIDDKNLKDTFEVRNLQDVPMETIIKDYIDNDIPVIFWATINLLPTKLTTKWLVPETGEEYQWRGNEHCLLLVGYDNDKKQYIFNDPWANHGVIRYDMTVVEERHKEQFSMAVALVKTK